MDVNRELIDGVVDRVYKAKLDQAAIPPQLEISREQLAKIKGTLYVLFEGFERSYEAIIVYEAVEHLVGLIAVEILERLPTLLVDIKAARKNESDSVGGDIPM